MVIFISVISVTAPVIGNGLTLGLTNGTNQFGLASASMYGTNADTLVYSTNQGSSVGDTPYIAPFAQNKNVGITQDPSKSGLIAQLSDIALGTVPSKKLGNFYIKY